MNKHSYYDILQVSSDASAEVITSAYRTIMSKLKKHPDLGGDADEARLINEAYETLSNVDSRRKYDASLANGSTPKFESVIKKKNFDERRRAPRRTVDASISFCIDNGQNWHPGMIKDVSVLGIKMQSHEALEVGQHLIIVPPNTASTAIHGTVRWKRMFHPTKFERVYEAGIEFADQIVDIDDRIS